MATCPVCSTLLVKEESQGDRYFYECPRCGPYSLTGRAKAVLPINLGSEQTASARLSHALSKLNSQERRVVLSAELLENIISNSSVPGPRDQLDNFILWMGKQQPSLGGTIRYSGRTISALGAVDNESAAFIVVHAIERGLVLAQIARAYGEPPSFGPLQLSFDGWEYFRELQRGHSASGIAVIVMQYGDPILDAIVKDYFKPAVAATGFELKRIDEGQPAGLIDDRMRVEIRQARFLISDLSHENNGAYWEAGYAEGLGKPVIYTCRKDVHEKEGTHFDTNHHLTVVWDPENIAEALEKLKATIRATLPEEAKLND